MFRALHDARVEFVVVGGLAAVLDGAPVNTFDLGVVHARNDANTARLLAVLLNGGEQALSPVYCDSLA